MAIQLMSLPYQKDELAPIISPETIDYHYGKHHQNYVNTLNKLLENSELEAFSLEEIVLRSEGAIFNNAAQVWNHNFYWNCLSPLGGGEPQGKLAQAINQSFGSFSAFCEQFDQAALKQFGSGWAWLIQESNDQLRIVTTSNASNPLTQKMHPLLTCDVWEHAYYIDYRNNRAKYLQQFWRLANWDFVASQLK